ncbi:hypothetical protein HYV82_05980 [Candidatus Woesearchaeota archaeon]|nr:hypothetical protein [Candidatus Woesearchaeota archaeon]
MEITDLPAINWPGASGSYKVVQLYLGEGPDRRPYLRFQEGGVISHAGILLGLAGLLGRQCPFLMGLPHLISEWYRFVGAGYADVNVEKKEAEFYGGSGSYPMGISSKHLEAIAESARNDGWNIKIR